MEKLLEITLLYDFYGELLTPNQKNIYELYYQNDLSLGEISKNLGISRQGVYDTLKRSEKLLYEYEQRLRLLERFQAKKILAKKILSCTESIEKYLGLETNHDKNCLNDLNTIKKLVYKILDQE
ncbi:MAG: YlxM family DNA-binding protein [Epulopiscium sp.]|nr:YlxM family DNA-binding protein [Candidatus Epulonipiscium sp.]